MGVPLVVVDAANVVGSVPDGWWRDRRGAAERLREGLSGLGATGLPGLGAPVEVVLVVEGAAVGVPSSATVRVVDAAGEGDDTIVAVVADAARAENARDVHVVTADRGLRDRVRALGATVHGPRTVRPTNTM